MKTLRVSEMAAAEKPVEKMMEHGPEVLSDAELLAIILRCGTKDMNVITLSQLILNDHPVHKGLPGLNYRTLQELQEIPGVGRMKACQIMAVTEISRRISSEGYRSKNNLDSTESIANYFMEKVRYLTKERVYAVYLNSNLDYIHQIKLSEGSIDRALVSPRDIFYEALKLNARYVVLLHNHPSGSTDPSEVDTLITMRIRDLGKDLGVDLLDHIIIGDGKYYSFRDNGVL